jgi:phosphatidylglycerol:prolipoprotein diacylglycerol transferase
MVPYFPPLRIHLFGPVYIHAFGVLVAAAVIAGWRLSLARCRRKGLDPDRFRDLLVYVIGTGFVCAHLYSVVAYFPGDAMRNPLLLLKVWENISSFGGIAGGLLGFWLYFRIEGRKAGFAERLASIDVIAWAFPFAWAIGRLGCTVAHDHPGTVTSFPLAVSLESAEAREYIQYVYREAGRLAELPGAAELGKLGFHDLGWYEFLYTLLVMIPVFLLLDRKERAPGFYPLAFPLLYVPARFLLDFLRLSDATYFGLTPGQYAGAAAFGVASVLAWTGVLRKGRGNGSGDGPA